MHGARPWLCELRRAFFVSFVDEKWRTGRDWLRLTQLLSNVLFFDRKAAQEKPRTKKLWIYDLRTNQHFPLKENPLKREHLDDFVACYHAKNRHTRKETERFKAFDYADLIKRDKINLDIMEDLQEALEQFATIAEDLKVDV